MGPILPQTPHPDTPSLHITVTNVSLVGGRYPRLWYPWIPSQGSRLPSKASHEPGHVTQEPQTTGGPQIYSVCQGAPVLPLLSTFRFAVHGGLQQHVPLALGSESRAARAAVALSCRPFTRPSIRPCAGAGGLSLGSSLLPRFPCPRADITAQRRDSRAGDRRTGGQKDARPPWKEETPPATPAPAARTARFSSHPSLPTAPLGKLSHRGRGGKHTAGHCGANLPPSPSLGTTVSPPALQAMPASWSQPPETAPLSAPIPLAPRAGHEPRSKHHPAERTTDPKLLPVSTPGRDALCTAPCPHPCQLHCRQAQSRGQPRLTSLRGAVPPALLLTSALLFFFNNIYIYKTTMAVLCTSHG